MATVFPLRVGSVFVMYYNVDMLAAFQPSVLSHSQDSKRPGEPPKNDDEAMSVNCIVGVA